jgi:PEP-CTERM motif
MKSPLASLAAAVFLGLAADANAGLIDLTVKPGAVYNLNTGGAGSSLALTTATSSGVAGLSNESYSLGNSADLNLLTATTLSLTGIPGESTITGTHGTFTSANDGAGGYILKSIVAIAAPAGYSAYDNGTLTLDVTSNGTVKSGDLVLGSAVPEPASLVMMAMGLGAVLGGYRLRRRKAAMA